MIRISTTFFGNAMQHVQTDRIGRQLPSHGLDVLAHAYTFLNVFEYV